jgi:hypothetical protein
MYLVCLVVSALRPGEVTGNMWAFARGQTAIPAPSTAFDSRPSAFPEYDRYGKPVVIGGVRRPDLHRLAEVAARKAVAKLNEPIP